MKKVELLSPAGNMEKLEMVFEYGADAAYLGGKLFNLRAFANNFTDEELEQAVKYAHDRDKKVYVTLNIIPHNEDLELVPEYVKYLEKIGVDGVIVADIGMLSVVKENSNIPISVSTQASNTNWRSVKMWYELGARRVVLAREVSLENIKLIKEKVPEMEVEVFIHGAMCMSISGRCLISNYLTGRDANRGSCAQPCRWKYHLVEEKRPGEYFPVMEDERYTYFFNAKDLCSIEFIEKLLDAGVDSLKIEGRMKGIYYGAITTKQYREALDSYYSGDYKYNPKWLEELETVSHRHYTSGFYYDRPDENGQNYETASYKQSQELVAKVIEELPNNEYILAIRNRIFVGEEVVLVRPVGENINLPFPAMINMKDNEEIEVAHPNTTVKIKMENIKLGVLNMFRKTR